MPSPSFARAVLFSFLVALPAAAQGVLVPVVPEGTASTAPPFVVESHRAKVEISHRIATVEIEMAFRNPGAAPVEGIFLFPVPRGTAIQDFVLRSGGKVLESQLLDAEEARRLYESIVNQRKDPGLLQFAGQSCVQARVFPVEAGGTAGISLSFASLTTTEDGVVRWTYPLRSLRQGAPAQDGVSVEIRIVEDEPIRSVFSPTHEVLVARHGDREAEVEYAPVGQAPYLEEDLVLYYAVSRSEVGIHLLSHQVGEDDAYFALLAAPAVEGFEPIAKDVVFVLDTSGSMRDGKWDQAAGAVEHCLGRLGAGDRFGVVAFSTDVRVFASNLVAVGPDAVAQGTGFVHSQRVNGGTALDGAIRRGFELLGRPEDREGREAFLVVITDGLPTIGERDSKKIVETIGSLGQGVRLFSFGVGYDVDAQLLDRLVADHGGWADYVHPGEALDQRVASFFKKVESPVLTDLRLEVEGLRVEDVYPQELPPLFAGGQIVAFGRAVGTGPMTVRLRGRVRGEERVYSATHTVGANRSDHTFLPALWATRKIGYLLDQIRLHGASDEVVQEVIRLSKVYGVLTEYTSFFADEAAAGDETALRRQLDSNLAAANAVRSGNWGTNQALNLRNYKELTCGSQVNVLFGSSGANQYRVATVRRVADKVFYLRGDTWYDAAYDGKMAVEEVQNFSDSYWTLNRGDLDMARYQALGDKVLIVKEGKALHCK